MKLHSKRKITCLESGFKFNHVTLKCQISFLDKTCKVRSKTEELITIIEFYTLKIVLAPNFSLN